MPNNAARQVKATPRWRSRRGYLSENRLLLRSYLTCLTDCHHKESMKRRAKWRARLLSDALSGRTSLSDRDDCMTISPPTWVRASIVAIGIFAAVLSIALLDPTINILALFPRRQNQSELWWTLLSACVAPICLFIIGLYWFDTAIALQSQSPRTRRPRFLNGNRLCTVSPWSPVAFLSSRGPTKRWANRGKHDHGAI